MSVHLARNRTSEMGQWADMSAQPWAVSSLSRNGHRQRPGHSTGSAMARLVKPVKMMDRPVAMADTEAIGRRDRGAEPGLGGANRGFHVLAFRETGGDGR